MQDISPGSTLHIKIVKSPSNAAAAKTLVRILNKDQDIARDLRRLRKIREKGLRTKTRGGRQWHVRMVKQHRIRGRVGESGTIRATLDVLRDLRRVTRFVEIQAS